MAIIIRAYKNKIEFAPISHPFTDVPNYWATQYIDKGYGANIIQGVSQNRFYPYKEVTRAEAITMLYRSQQLLE